MGDHYLYAYNSARVRECLITIPEEVGLSNVDGFSIDGSSAYFADSLGPTYATSPDKWGGSVYRVDWIDPCSCSAGTCEAHVAVWKPTKTKEWTFSASDPSIDAHAS